MTISQTAEKNYEIDLYVVHHRMPRSPKIYTGPLDIHSTLQLEWKGNENNAVCLKDVGAEQVTPKGSGRVKHLVRS